MDRFTRAIAMASARTPVAHLVSWVAVLAAQFVLLPPGRHRRRLLRPGQPERPGDGPCRGEPPRGREERPSSSPRPRGHDHRRGPAGRRRVPRRGRHPRPRATSVSDPLPDRDDLPRDGRIAEPCFTSTSLERDMGKPAFLRAVRRRSGIEATGPAGRLGGRRGLPQPEDETSGHVGIGRWSRCWCSGGLRYRRRRPPPSACRSSLSVPASVPSPCRLDDRLGRGSPSPGWSGLGVGVDYALRGRPYRETGPPATTTGAVAHA